MKCGLAQVTRDCKKSTSTANKSGEYALKNAFNQESICPEDSVELAKLYCLKRIMLALESINEQIKKED